jgi:hypothetical protein
LIPGCAETRPAEVREFPEGFFGWAIIIWDIPGSPALPIENGKILERFPSDGVLITSSKLHFGVATDEYYFIDGDGRRLSVKPQTRAGAVGNMQQSGRRMDFFSEFIGTDEQRKSAPKRDQLLSELFHRLFPSA